jgi:PHP family Zn ribbon phosphoesterase
MKLAADLHIHSALSPCSDNDMTPNNIINMAILKGLDIISITDHNCALNLPAFQKTAYDLGIFLLPGIEVQTREEIHMLCYFPSVEHALELGETIYKMLPETCNNARLFGEQLIMDSNDNIAGCVNKLLLSSADISIDSLIEIVCKMGGVCVPAHVDRSSYSIISNLGFIPKSYALNTVEISKGEDYTSASERFPCIKGLRMIRSSDAHYLYDILERESFIEIEELAISKIIDYIRC